MKSKPNKVVSIEIVRVKEAVSALTDVELLMLDKREIVRLIGDISKPKSISYTMFQSIKKPPKKSFDANIRKKKSSAKEGSFAKITIANLILQTLLGEGGFGKVELVKLKDCDQYFARKQVSKTKINKKQVDLERAIMQTGECDFIVRLYNTLADGDYVYLIMEACLGGELWLHLKNEGLFSEERTQFYIACTIEAVDFLHKRKIVYRDIKPENLLLDSIGYAKLADFGLSKVTKPGTKRWSFCGTPEYMAPEIILRTGHDFPVDYWSLGILIYELTQGEVPFRSTRSIVKGIDIASFSVKITKACRDIIKGLVNVNQTKRLGNFKNGIDDIRNHRWFQAFDWPSLQDRVLPVPWKPELTSNCDTRYFEETE